MASSAYTKPWYMKLLVSKSTKTLVPTKASGRLHAGQGVLVGFEQRAGGAVLAHRQRRLGAFGEGGDLLQNAVLEDAEIGGLQAVDVVALLSVT